MRTLRRASRHLDRTAAAGFERGRVAGAGAGAGAGVGIGLAPGLNEPAGFVVDLDRVLAGMPRRSVAVEPSRPWPQVRRTRGRWPRTPFRLPSAARIRIRDKGRRR